MTSEDHTTVYRKLYMFDIIAEFVLLMNNYFFVFEIFAVYVVLHSNSHREYELGMKKWRALKTLVYVIESICFGIGITLYYIRYVKNSGDMISMNDEFEFLVIRIIGMIIDINMVLLFTKVAKFFIKEKLKSSRIKQREN